MYYTLVWKHFGDYSMRNYHLQNPLRAKWHGQYVTGVGWGIYRGGGQREEARDAMEVSQCACLNETESCMPPRPQTLLSIGLQCTRHTVQYVSLRPVCKVKPCI